MQPKILFIGGTPRGLKLMQALLAQEEKITYAYILKEDPHEQVKASSELAGLCRREAIGFKVCKKISRGEVAEILQSGPEVAFVCGWRTLLPPELYRNIPLGCLAAHDSLLPKYRGFAPLNWAIINGEKRTGVTLFKISDGVVDSGEIFAQKVVEIGPADTAAQVYPRIVEATVSLYREFLAALRAGKITWTKQDEAQATYTCKRTPEDGEIDWQKSAEEIFNLIRALSPPYPCAWTRFMGKKLYIAKAVLAHEQKHYCGNAPGRVTATNGKSAVVLCGCGQVVLEEIINEAGEEIDAKALFSSVKATLGK